MVDTKDEPSKSQLKREMTALQQIGEDLVGLSLSQLNKMGLDESLLSAIKDAKNYTNHGAVRRQLQYIGKLMRHTEVEPIIAELDKILNKDKLNKAKFHYLEAWRTKLIDGDNTELQNFIDSFPHCDRQQLRQLVKNAKDAKLHNKSNNSSKALFRLITDVIAAASQSE
jgi:ribosome-associated protein